MNWDQIETNWVAMTRRIRPERREPEESIKRGPQQPSGDMAELGVNGAELPEQRGPAFARQVR